jgi:hypothetical protein
VLETVPAFLWCVEIADRADGFPEFLNGAGTGSSQMGFELGKGHLDGIEVRAVGRQEEKPGAAFRAMWGIG